MIAGQEQRRRFRHIVPSILCACVFSYFAYHATQGERGIVAWWQIGNQLQESQATLAQLTAERKSEEHRVALLRPESLDPDMLEERARVMLNFGQADDRLLIIKDKSVTN
jgi:cell division protein FtsB